MRAAVVLLKSTMSAERLSLIVAAEVDGVGDAGERPAVDLGLQQRLKDDRSLTGSEVFGRGDRGRRCRLEDPALCVLPDRR